MADVIATNSEIARVGIQELIPVFDKQEKNYWQMIGFRKVTTTQEFHRVYQEAGFGLATTFSEGSPIPLQSFTNPYSLDVYWASRGLGYSCSYNKIATDQYGVMDRIAPKMAYSMKATFEVVAAAVFDNATNTASQYLGPDGQPLASASHPYQGGTMRNTQSLALSDANAELALQDLMEQKDYKGIAMAYDGPLTLLCGTANIGIANRMKMTRKVTESAENDESYAASRINKLVVNPHLQDTNGWGFIANNNRKHGLLLLQLGGDTVETERYKATKTVAFYRSAEFTFRHVDHRGVWWSPGAS